LDDGTPCGRQKSPVYLPRNFVRCRVFNTLNTNV
jgi:hypothetical protein